MHPSCVFISCTWSASGAAGSSERTRVSSASRSADDTPPGIALMPRANSAAHAAKMADRSCGQLLPRAKRSILACSCGHVLDGRSLPASSAATRRTSSGSRSSLMRRSKTAAMHAGALAPCSASGEGRSPYKASSASGSSNASSGSTRSSSSGLSRLNTASWSTTLVDGSGCAASSACTRARRYAPGPPPEPMDAPSADATRTGNESPGAAAIAARSVSMAGGHAAGSTSAAHLLRMPTARSTAVSRPSGRGPEAATTPTCSASPACAAGVVCCGAAHAKNARSACAGSPKRNTAPTASAAAERVRASRSPHSWISGGSTHSAVSLPSRAAAALRVGRSRSDRHGSSFSTKASA